MDSGHWKDLCRWHVLEYRAVCNAAVEPNNRPVKRRVMERLSQSGQAKPLFEKVWRRIPQGLTSQDQAATFFELLVQDSGWETLVLEGVHEERSWGDLWSRKLELLDKIRSFIEKLSDGKAHPVAKTTAVTASSLCSLLLIQQLSPNVLKDATAPVRAVFTSTEPLVIELRTKDNSIPINFNFPTTLPPIQATLSLKTDDTAIPVRVSANFVGTEKGNDPIGNVATYLQNATRSIEKVSQKLEAASTTSTRDLTELRTSFEGIGDKVQLLTNAYSQAATTELSGLQVVADASVVPQRRIVEALRENSLQSIVLPSFDSKSGAISWTTLDVCVGRITHRSVQIQQSNPGSGICPIDGWRELTQGKSATFTNVPWQMTFSSSAVRWYGRNSAKVTLSPASPPPTLVKSSEQPAGAGGAAGNLPQDLSVSAPQVSPAR